MTALIRVINGPDDGASFPVPKNPVRIGIGANVEIRLSDAQLRGSLLVEWKNGTYHVRNDMEFAVYLDKQPLARGESRVWFDDEVLQPSAQTQLVLQHTDDSAAGEPGRLVLPGQQTKSNKAGSRGILAIAAVGVCLGLLLLATPGEPLVIKPDINKTIVKRSAEAIRDLEACKQWAESNKVHREWARLSQLFQQARIADRQGDRRAALERYQDCLTIVNGISELFPYDKSQSDGMDPARMAAMEAIENMGQILNARLIELAQ